MSVILLALKPYLLPVAAAVIGWLSPRRSPATDWLLFGSGVAAGAVIVILVKFIA